MEDVKRWLEGQFEDQTMKDFVRRIDLELELVSSRYDKTIRSWCFFVH